MHPSLVVPLASPSYAGNLFDGAPWVIPVGVNSPVKRSLHNFCVRLKYVILSKVSHIWEALESSTPSR